MPRAKVRIPTMDAVVDRGLSVVGGQLGGLVIGQKWACIVLDRRAAHVSTVFVEYSMEPVVSCRV